MRTALPNKKYSFYMCMRLHNYTKYDIICVYGDIDRDDNTLFRAESMIVRRRKKN